MSRFNVSHLPGGSACILRQPAPVVGIVCGLHRFPPSPTQSAGTPKLSVRFPSRDFKIGYGALHGGGERSTDNGIEGSSRTRHARTTPARQAHHPRASAERMSNLPNCDQVRHYPAASASAIPTLTTDRPPTIDASQAISRTSDAIDLHIAVLLPYCTDEPGLGPLGSLRALGLSTATKATPARRKMLFRSC